ncbi:hypothetical protein ANO11243_085830 [Dothideomycetidae sp. 11243]|nr:hypothetical protein ANO11243_085830 [fungal sp. No.11243]
MAAEQLEDNSLKRKRTQRSRQGPSTTAKRRRADSDLTDNDNDVATEAQVDLVDQVSLEHKAEDLEATKRNSNRRGSLPTNNSQKANAPSITHPKTSRKDEERNKGWTVSRPAGGRFMARDPKFSKDGQFIVAAKDHQLHIFSPEDSLLYKTIPAPESSAVRAFATSRIERDRMYFGFSNPDRVEAWDLEDTRTPISTEAIEGDIIQIALGRAAQDDEETLYVLSKANGQSVIYRAGKIVAKTHTDLLDFCISGDVFVAIGPNTLLAGKVQDDVLTTQFVEWDIPSQITCFAIRKHAPLSGKKKHSAPSETRLSIALGTATGALFAFENVLIADKAAASSLPAFRTLHWHRDAVGSVKWSRDGNYLVSGGRETVLVIWQLATGKKQFLPHLTAEIEQITVAPNGASYALQLADNSIMVLSTSELRPTAHFPDLQAQFPQGATQTLIEGSSAVSDTHHLKFNSYRMVGGFHPVRKDQLHIVVPPSIQCSHIHTNSLPKPFLQSFDISNDRHLYRQALTRNKVTDLSTGPEGTRIQEPDVYLMKLNHDGSVMATIETWEPLGKDYKFLAHDESSNQEQTRLNRETYLKFWHWNESKNSWAMQNRISNPHPWSCGAEPGQVLDLVADPASSRFYSIGEDSIIRSWTPRKPARVVATPGPQEWSSRSHVSLPATDSLASTSERTTVSGVLSISPDSSLLAASIVSPSSSTSTIHLLTTSPLQSLAVLPPVPGQIHSIAFSGRSVYVISTEVFTVYDIPTLRPTTSIAVPQPKPHIPLPLRHRPLALSASTNPLAAVAHPTASTQDPSRPYTQIEVLDLSRTKKQVRLRTTVPGIVTGLFPDPRLRSAFLAIKADSSVLRIAGPRDAAGTDIGMAAAVAQRVLPSSSEHKPAAVASAAQDDIGEEVMHDVSPPPRMEVALRQQQQGDKPVVRPEQLARLFEGAAVGAMPVRAMFEGVMDLFVAKPVAFVGGQ